MATRNIVPRAADEGQIGTGGKRWLKGWFGTVQTEAVTDGTTTATVAQLGSLDGVSGNVQAQLDAKANSSALPASTDDLPEGTTHHYFPQTHTPHATWGIGGTTHLQRFANGTLQISQDGGASWNDIGGGTAPSGSGGLEAETARVQAILRGSTTTTAQAFGHALVAADRYRIPAGQVAQRGWVRAVEAVTLDSAPLTAIFQPACQTLYFPAAKTGACHVAGAADALTVSIDATVGSDSLSTGSVPSAVTDVAVGGVSVPFRFNAAQQYIFLLTDFPATAAVFEVQHAGGATSRLEAPAFTGNQRLLSGLFTTVSGVAVNGAAVDYTFASPTLTLATAVSVPSVLTVTAHTAAGETVTHTMPNFTGSQYALPTAVAAVATVKLAAYAGMTDYYPYTDFDAAAQTVYLGAVFDGQLAIAGTRADGATLSWTQEALDGNGIWFPPRLTAVTSVQVSNAAQRYLFDYYAATLHFLGPRTGTLAFTGTVAPYEGVALGGETLAVVAELPGLLATTCGTGEPVTVLRQLDGRVWDLTAFNSLGVGVTDEDETFIYVDESRDGARWLRDGFMDPSLLPITPKLPLAPAWPEVRRDDRAFFGEAFAPEAGFTYAVSGYLALDDSLRAGVLGPGSALTLSTDATLPVRGVAGATLDGMTPLFYAGVMRAQALVALYKWFVCTVADPHDNPALSAGQRVLLCVHNVVTDTTLACALYPEGPSVAVEIYTL